MSTFAEALDQLREMRCDSEGCCLHELPPGHPEAPGRMCCWCGTAFVLPQEHGKWCGGLPVLVQPALPPEPVEPFEATFLMEAQEKEGKVAQALVALQGAAHLWAAEDGRGGSAGRELADVLRAHHALARAEGYTDPEVAAWLLADLRARVWERLEAAIGSAGVTPGENLLARAILQAAIEGTPLVRP